MNPKPIIETKNLTKTFGDVKAVDDISFSVGNGEIFALLGPNGAGKSTMIKMLITLLGPSTGKATIDGLDVVEKSSEVRRVIGYVPQLISVDGTLTAYENLMLMARLYDVPAKDRRSRVADILSFLKLEKYGNSLVRTLSGGMIRRLEIGQAMVHHPKVIFLDEPTSGLDPVAKNNVWEHLRELRDRYGTTIFFSTHQMDEADEMSDRVAIMNAGKIAAMGTPAEIKTMTKKEGATLEDAFIFLTGNESYNQTANFRELQRSRRNESKLG
jgi:ABC-2 type transport system ATP-binding protein